MKEKHAMFTDEDNISITELTNSAAELAARAVACGLARLIEAYVPPRLAQNFGLRVAIVLLRELNVHDSGPRSSADRAS
jgi:hypothetical protein